MFSATDAAFAGFRVLQRKPSVLAWWAGFYLLFSVVVVTLLIVMAGPQMMQLQRMEETSDQDPAAALAALAAVGPALAVMMVLYFLYYGVVYAAVSRAVLKPEDSATGYLRFGGAELWQALLVLVIGLLYFLLIIAVSIAGALMIRLGGEGSPILAVLGGLVLVFGLVAASLWFGVKFSLASPQTFATGRFNLFGSFKLSSGHFWPMLGAYALATLLTIVVSLVTMGITFGVLFLTVGWSGLSGVMNPDMSTVASLFTPAQAAYYVVSSIVTAATTLIFVAPTADIYRQLTGGDSAAAFE